MGSYPAISTLPDPAPTPLAGSQSGPSAVYFLWHCSSPRGVRSLTGILLYGARTFLPAPSGEESPGFPALWFRRNLLAQLTPTPQAPAYANVLSCPHLTCAATVWPASARSLTPKPAAKAVNWHRTIPPRLNDWWHQRRFDELFKFPCWQRFAEVITLHFVAALQTQEGELPGSFDPFRDGLHP